MAVIVYTLAVLMDIMGIACIVYSIREDRKLFKELKERDLI